MKMGGGGENTNVIQTAKHGGFLKYPEIGMDLGNNFKSKRCLGLKISKFEQLLGGYTCQEKHPPRAIHT